MMAEHLENDLDDELNGILGRLKVAFNQAFSTQFRCIVKADLLSCLGRGWDGRISELLGCQ
jgi:hypothetical protein